MIGAGLLAACSGLWMTHFYPLPVELQGPLLYWVRMAVGVAMIASIICGLLAIRQKQIASHQVWMIRAYALGQGAGTQVLVTIPWLITVGEPTGLTRDLLMTFAWGLNLSVAQAVWVGSSRFQG